MSQEDLAGLIGHIYDAALDPGLWASTVTRIADLVGASSGSLFFQEADSNEVPMHMVARIDPHYVRLYDEYFARVNPWVDGILAWPEGSVVPSHAIIGLPDLMRTEFYGDYLRPRGVLHCVGAMPFKSVAALGCLALYRSRTLEPFDGAEVGALRLLTPHLRRALEISQRFAAFRAGAEAIGSALNRMPMGVFLLDGAGRVLVMNAAASEIGAEADGLSVGCSGLGAANAGESNALRKLIGAAIACAAGAGLEPGGAISLSRPSGLRPLSALVAPLKADEKLAQAFGAPMAVVFVSDPERKVESSAAVLQRLYGLTPAEARLAQLALEGHGLPQIAEMLEITDNTARTHLKKIFAKTDTSRQSELVRLLLTGPAPLSGKAASTAGEAGAAGRAGSA